MDTRKNTPACLRCGACCLRGGPALHQEDLPLLAAGTLARAHLLTLRAGEPVFENVAQVMTTLHSELVKVAWLPGEPGAANQGKAFACRFYAPEESACLIHETRPAECRALFCQDTAAIEALYARDRLTRAHIVDTRGSLWEIVSFHEESFPAATATALARASARGDRIAAREFEALADAERRFREAFAARTALPPQELEFYFGRSLAQVCAPLLGTPSLGEKKSG
ncbi:YkgJ family cysteine cluster protein [Fundidesulfovibrio agrisoli]|uniref:YkgJ family cysteine cluster protein n=1 Tax=Fundidesulfovibrio agrisoli TaxID=2922717 RepID=UPI001FABB076|nr:YkgJ family cysteine cluster protein [Fundidesulfovibrio agrisoli]